MACHPLSLRAASCLTLVLIASCVLGQNSNRYSGNQPARTPENNAGLSDLAKENLDLVAASPVQIRAILAKDPGLVVELKRWIAKEATDSGQVLEESKLSEEAIFDRLDKDIEFRAVATRLLQRYGYLLPSPNPESDMAKEQEFVLKERARRLVQIEDQDDSPAPAETNKPEEQVDRTGTRERGQDGECGARDDSGRRGAACKHNEIAPPNMSPFTAPDSPATSTRPHTSVTDLIPEESGGEFGSGNAELELAAGSLPSNVDPLSLPRAAEPLAPADLARGASRVGSDKNSTLSDTGDVLPPTRRSLPSSSRRPSTAATDDNNPVNVADSLNPYADIPSLYDMYAHAGVSQRAPERFGLDIFRNSDDQTDAIPMDIPVGPEYVVGTGDSLAIDLWGSVSQRLVRLVDREGRVSLPDAGPLLVSGRTLGDIQFDIQRALRNVYRDVSADVSLARLRTVRVYVVGDVVEPGAYDISALSTPLNALFAAGGITAGGSLRRLQHFRGKQLIQEVDAYDLLLHGVRSDLKRLESGDTLLVPPVGPQVTIEGMVRRPGIYELLDETSLAETLALAGGILPTAALRHVEVQRVEAHEKRTMVSLNVSEQDQKAEALQLKAFTVRDGDKIHIFPIAPFNEDAIYLQGHVLRPGRYAYKPGMKVTDLISTYADLLPEPAPHYAEIVRLNPPDFRPTVESFDLAGALSNPASAPSLNRLDTVRIFSRYDFERPPTVFVGGEVHSPGNYRTSGQAHLRDAIYLAGGITPDASLNSAQLFRTQADGTLRILSVDLREALAGNPVDNILIQPRDRLLIHRKFEKVDAPTVNITGEVVKPGRYPLTTNMRVADLVRTAGGMKRSAFLDTADLTHFAVGNTPSEHKEVMLSAALSGDANEDVPLHNGDVLAVRQIPHWNDLGASVTVSGEVQHPATYGIQPGERLSSVLARCNGFTEEAYPYGAVLIRREVRDLEMRSHLELVNRIKAEQAYLKSLPENDADQKTAKMTAIAQTDTALSQLEATAPVGRVVIHIPPDFERLARSASDIPMRNGDVLIVPKKMNYVSVSGEVFNPTAVAYLPGRSAKWYLSQSGGLTQIADKKAVFVVRADGSVVSAKNNSGIWSGDPLNVVLKPGDSIVVPEKAPKMAPRNWASLIQAAQVASSVALTVGYLHP